jgi:hypothetical protein
MALPTAKSQCVLSRNGGDAEREQVPHRIRPISGRADMQRRTPHGKTIILMLSIMK